MGGRRMATYREVLGDSRREGGKSRWGDGARNGEGWDDGGGGWNRRRWDDRTWGMEKYKKVRIFRNVPYLS